MNTNEFRKPFAGKKSGQRQAPWHLFPSHWSFLDHIIRHWRHIMRKCQILNLRWVIKWVLFDAVDSNSLQGKLGIEIQIETCSPSWPGLSLVLLQRFMADIISVLALTMSEEGDRVRDLLLTFSCFYCKKFLSICIFKWLKFTKDFQMIWHLSCFIFTVLFWFGIDLWQTVWSLVIEC